MGAFTEETMEQSLTDTVRSELMNYIHAADNLEESLYLYGMLDALHRIDIRLYELNDENKELRERNFKLASERTKFKDEVERLTDKGTDE